MGPADVNSGAAETIIRGALAFGAPEVEVCADLDGAAHALVADTLAALADAITRRGVAHVALTGGTGGAAVATALVDALTRGVDGVNPATVHIWFGDERFVDATDPERNDLLATGLLDAGVRTVRFHTLAGPDEVADVGVAARLLAREFHEFGPDDGRFDVVHLGVGPDAHVCSLFPGHPAALTIDADIVSVDDSPKPPSRRVTFTFPVLQRARRLMLIAAGSSKAQAVRAGLADPDPVGAPASCARAQRTTWYVDEAALAGS